MSRPVSALLGLLLLAGALAGSACGRYGPPVRASERGAAREENPPPPEITDPTVDPDDPVLPDPTLEAP